MDAKQDANPVIGVRKVNYRESIEVIVLDLKLSPKARKRVAEHVQAKTCLCGCGKPILKRGLAANCYYAWRRVRSTMSKQEAAAYDANLIRKGFLLAAQQVRRIIASTVFDKVARS
jgi:hypothetical protein